MNVRGRRNVPNGNQEKGNGKVGLSAKMGREGKRGRERKYILGMKEERKRNRIGKEMERRGQGEVE